MKKMFLFLIVTMLVVSESSTVYKPQPMKMASGIPCYNLAINRVFSVLPRDLSYIPIYLRVIEEPVVTFSGDGYVTAANIDLEVWCKSTNVSFFHTIPAGTILNASYNVPYPTTWLSNGSLKKEMTGILMMMNPRQNGLKIDVTEITTSLDQAI